MKENWKKDFHMKGIQSVFVKTINWTQTETIDDGEKNAFLNCLLRMKQFHLIFAIRHSHTIELTSSIASRFYF